MLSSIDSSEDADFIGCVTDRLPTGRELTIPVYANYCSAHCYEEDEAALARLERCPYGGEQHEIPTGIHREGTQFCTRRQNELCSEVWQTIL